MRTPSITLKLTLALLSTIFVASCFGMAIPIGPIPVLIDLGGGVLDPAAFAGLPAGVTGTITVENDLCNLPSEDVLLAVLEVVGDFDVSGLVDLTDLEVVTMTITASTGDFATLTDMVLTYIPKPLDGVPQAGIALGAASEPAGFGTTIVLTPSGDVDLLDLVRENDANPSAECPRLQVQVTGSLPPGPIAWTLSADLDAYGTLGV